LSAAARPTDPALQALCAGRHDDPFAVLGPHDMSGLRYVTAFDPRAAALSARAGGDTFGLAAVPGHPGLFRGPVPGDGPYRLTGETPDGIPFDHDDPYRFGPVLGEIDEYLIGEGTHRRLWTALGAHFLPLSEHPFRRVLGLSAGRPLRADDPPRSAARVSRSGRSRAREGHRHPARLGARPFPDRRARPRPLRRHGALRARRSARGLHPDWNTLIFNYGRTEVSNYLVSNALYWLEEYHVDGLRVDAVASMLYRDYSRKEGEWIPNVHGGRENLEAIAMLQRMNTTVYGEVAGIMTVAEESTSYPGVSRPVDTGGLGFGYKWNMGWMNDTLDYIGREPIHRKYHHHQMTFGLHYAFSENFILPISHDEVVHGKGSMLARMPGNDTERFANLRAYYGFMWGHPGKKLLFMGCEFAQPEEWRQSGELNWNAAERPAHAGVQRLIRDLNTLYRATPALHVKDCDSDGFQWIEANAAEDSIYAWIRRGGPDDPPVVVICNFTPVERRDWRCGLPLQGKWREALNTDADIYGGGNRGNMGGVVATGEAMHGQPASAPVTLPPLSTVILAFEE
jgi:1,4-alpha-glucan branching enzyme